MRSVSDRAALRAALRDGVIDALVSDHTPVDADEKILPFSDATPGATGLELLLSLALQWAQTDQIALPQALAAVTYRPAQILGAELGASTTASATSTDADSTGSTNVRKGIGQLLPGGVADLCIVDPDARWQVSEHTLHSHGKFTPFEGQLLPGRVTHTLVDGRIVFAAEANG